MVLDVIRETSLELFRERMVQFHFYLSEILPDGNPVPAERLSLGKPVELSHEAPCIIAQGVIAFLEFVKFLDYSYRNHEVIVLKSAY